MALPGLQKLNIPQNTASGSVKRGGVSSNALKTTASKGLATTPKATGLAFKTTTTAYYGVGAKRSVAGSGALFNAKAYNSDSIGMQRYQLNSNRTRIADVWNNPNWANLQKASGNDGMNKFAAGLMAVNMLAGLTAQAIDVANSFKSSGSTDAIKAKDGDNKTSSTTSLNEMKSAKDSSTLRGAIETAKNNKAQMQSDLKALEGKLPAMKKASEAATKQLEELTPKVEAKEKEVKAKETDVTEKEGKVKEKKSSLEAAEKRLASCDTAFKEACTQYDNAQAGLTQAKTSLASAKANIDHNTGKPAEPAYSRAEEAVKRAEENVRQAEDAKQKAAGNLEQAKTDNNTAKQVYLNAQEALKEANNDLNKSKQELEQLKEELEPLKQQQSDAQKQVDAYKKAVDQQTELKSNIASLEAEIPAQEKRLTELESKEAKGLKGAESTILQMADKLAGKDGKLGTEDDKKKLGSKDQEKFNNAKSIQRNVGYTQLYKTDGQTIDGKTFRTGLYNGETLYMIGAKKVDKTTYELKKRQAEDAQKFANDTLQKGVNPEMQKRIIRGA